MKLSVALCTYNGAKYLHQQLKSIASQARLPDELVVCDDASSDTTLLILRAFAARAQFPVHIYTNTINLGVRKNFSKAISLCSGELIALCDQDDVWRPDKVFQAEKAILQSGNPLLSLYCSRLQYVNASLEPVGLSLIPHNVGFENAVVENIATGCSVVFGAEIGRYFLAASTDDMVMHDWWVYLLATSFGQVIYDSTPSVFYRQHHNNVAGWQPRPQKIWNRVCSLFQRLQATKRGMDSLNQAARFIETYPDVPQKNRKIVEELLLLRDESSIKRLRYVLHPRVARNDSIENLGLKIMLLMGWH